MRGSGGGAGGGDMRGSGGGLGGGTGRGGMRAPSVCRWRSEQLISVRSKHE